MLTHVCAVLDDEFDGRRVPLVGPPEWEPFFVLAASGWYSFGFAPPPRWTLPRTRCARAIGSTLAGGVSSAGSRRQRGRCTFGYTSRVTSGEDKER